MLFYIASQSKLYLIHHFLDGKQTCFATFEIFMYCNILNDIKFAIKRLNCSFYNEIEQNKMCMCRSGGFITWSLFYLIYNQQQLFVSANFSEVSKTWNHCGIHRQTDERSMLIMMVFVMVRPLNTRQWKIYREFDRAI